MNETMLKQLEEKVTSLLQEQYLNGLAIGGKTFVALIYKTIVEAEESAQKSEKDILSEVKTLCRHLFDTNERSLGLETTESIEDAVKKMKEDE